MAGYDEVEMPSKYVLLTLPPAEFADQIRAYTMHEKVASVFEGKNYINIFSRFDLRTFPLVHLLSPTSIFILPASHSVSIY